MGSSSSQPQVPRPLMPSGKVARLKFEATISDGHPHGHEDAYPWGSANVWMVPPFASSAIRRVGLPCASWSLVALIEKPPLAVTPGRLLQTGR